MQHQGRSVRPGSLVGRHRPARATTQPPAEQNVGEHEHETVRRDAIEWTLDGVRIAVVAGIATLVAIGPRQYKPYASLAWVAVGVAGVYSLAISSRRVRLPLGLSSALDLVLTLVAIGCTGASESPIIGVLFLVVTSVSMRFDRRRAMVVALLGSLGLAIDAFAVPKPVLPDSTRATLLASWLVLLVLESITVGRLAEIESEERTLVALESAHRKSLVTLENERRALLGAILHDLRTPLAGAAGIARTLRKPPSGLRPAQAREAMRVLAEHLAYIEGLVGDVRQMVGLHQPGSLEEVSLRPVRLEPLLQSAVEVACDRVEQAGSGVSVSVEEQLPAFVRTDALKLQRIIVNLISNALEHAGPKDVEVVARRQGPERLRLEVRDRGPGLSEEAMGSLFSPPRSGVASMGAVAPPRGIGLWVVSELVHALGGTVEANRRPGGGTATIVYLPLLEEAGDPSGGLS